VKLERLVVATGNRGKLAEIRDVLAGTGIELVAQSALDIAGADETGATFVENALIKARHASRVSGLPALGDDSGICVDALGGEPGLISARYGGMHGDSAANIAKLLAALEGVEDARRSAHFHCTVVLLQNADDPAPLIAEGRWSGRILHAPRGTRGFGYDPIFFDPALGMGAGELDADVKNRVSHRGQALARLRELLG
jgi:XTP/dITP diphosphohydrolase